MKRNYSIEEKANGERAVLRMNEKARAFYNTTEPIELIEYDTDFGKRYRLRMFGGAAQDDITFEEVEKIFEDWHEECLRMFGCE